VTQWMMRRVVIGALMGLLLAISVFAATSAQNDDNCQMGGYVLDPQGRGVPQAEVILKVSGRTQASRVVTDLDGSYNIQLPELILQETGYMYTRIPSGDVTVVGHINFKKCRARRDVFTSQPAGEGYTPGPTPPAPPPVVPAYPGPDAPLPSLANAVAFFDLTVLPRGGVSPGDRFILPICVAAFASPLPQISKLTFIAEFDPQKVDVKGFKPLAGSPFSNAPIRQEIRLEMVRGRERGRIWYEVEAPRLVELPELPAPCLGVVGVEMETLVPPANQPTSPIGVRPGDTVGFSTIKGLDTNSLRDVNTSMRIGTFEGPIARTTTYLDILTRDEQQEVLKKSYLPMLLKRERLP
jgi:hypothetical protein